MYLIKKVFLGLSGLGLVLSLNAQAASVVPPPNVPAPAPAPMIAGGYSAISVNDAQVQAAARFAADKLGNKKAKLKSVNSAASQVVAGLNFRMNITLTDGKQYDVVVFQGLDGHHELTRSTPVASTAAKTYADPFAYCAAVKNADKLDARYSGPALPPVVLKALELSKEGEEMALNSPGYVSWRCMNKQVWMCMVGANIPCDSKADVSRKPTAEMKTFCKSDRNAKFIPAVAAGRTTVYEWCCRAGKPKIVSQAMKVDARGYPATYWTQVLAK